MYVSFKLDDNLYRLQSTRVPPYEFFSVVFDLSAKSQYRLRPPRAAGHVGTQLETVLYFLLPASVGFDGIRHDIVTGMPSLHRHGV